MRRNRLLTLFTFGVIAAFTAYLWRVRMATATLPSLNRSNDGATIVGSGLAGLSAASQLIAHGISVRLLERSPKPGGNSIKASSGINGAPTKYQPVSEPHDAFYSDTVSSAGKAFASKTGRREKLISTLTGKSSEAISWLVEEMGVDLSKVAQLGGHSYPRTHRGSGQTPPGAAIVTTLLQRLQESSLFELKIGCTVTKVLQDGLRVTGVKYVCEDDTVQEAHGPVIFAAGGFAGDAEGTLAQYRPDLAGYPSTNEPRPGAQPLLTTIGAQLLDMDLVQVHPTGFVDPAHPDSPVKFLAAEVLRGEGGLLLMNGKRFFNELETRENVTNAITSQPPMSTSPKQWSVQLILDEGTYRAAKPHVDFYLFKGLMKKTAIEDLGDDALESVRQYAVAAAKGPDHFGRTNFARWTLTNPTPESAVYVGTVTPVVHFTMGGVAINEHSEVLDEIDEKIEGLWAAGEVTGGVHGGNRLGGSSLLECVVFGRIAGDECAKYSQKTGKTGQ